MPIPRTCKAAVFLENDAPLGLKDIEPPKVAEEALLAKMIYSGICATDVHMWHSSDAIKPVIFGHENIAAVEDLGSRIKRDSLGNALNLGDRILFYGLPCGSCFNCFTARQPSLCTNRPYYGFDRCDEHPYLNGGFAEYIYVRPGSWIYRVPDEISTERALIAAIGNHVALNAIERIGGIRVGDTVVVQGCGPQGLGCILQSRLAGAGKIIAIGAPEARLNAAKALGSAVVIDLNDFPTPEARVARVLELSEGRGADVLFEASGAASAVDEGLQMIRVGGKYAVIGQATDYGPRSINPYHITTKQITVQGVWVSEPIHTIRAHKALSRVGYPLENLISHRFRLDQATEGLRAVERLEPIIGVVEPNR